MVEQHKRYNTMSNRIEYLLLRKRMVLSLVGLLGTIGFLTASVVASAESYQPMFESALLDSLDPQTRERFQKLETENRKRWENRNPVTSSSSQARAEAVKRHQETEQALRRIEESRRLKQRIQASQQERANLLRQHNQRCAELTREIEQLRIGGPIYEIAEDGARRYLTEPELIKRVKSREKRYKEACTG